MLVEAVLDGDLTADKTILDATSGNAGISYAMIGAALGYKVALVMPENASEERKKRIVAHGAEIIYTDAMLGYDEALYEVKRRFEQEPETYFWCDQYGNQNNPLMHYESTARRSWTRYLASLTSWPALARAAPSAASAGASRRSIPPFRSSASTRPNGPALKDSSRWARST